MEIPVGTGIDLAKQAVGGCEIHPAFRAGPVVTESRPGVVKHEENRTLLVGVLIDIRCRCLQRHAPPPPGSELLPFLPRLIKPNGILKRRIHSLKEFKAERSQCCRVSAVPIKVRPDLGRRKELLIRLKIMHPPVLISHPEYQPVKRGASDAILHLGTDKYPH